MEESEQDCANHTNKLFFEIVKRSTEDLNAWISKNGWAGYDPYDVKGTRLFMWALSLKKDRLIGRAARKAILGPLIIGEALFPKLFRFGFRIKPAINAKGMALFAKAYLQLYQTTEEERFKDKAIDCLEWLGQNKSHGYSESCWGYPFDWRSGVVIPANTPSSVVSAAACDAYWTAWKVLGETAYLDVCVDTCKFFINHLNIDGIDNETICFSYTPLDKFHVHNANLLVAELLVRVGKQIDNRDWINTGLKAANYALKEQNEDGSLWYWGKVQNHSNPNRVDHYHAGFEIRCLYSIWKLTGAVKFQVAVEKYYEYYLRRLISHEGRYAIPKMYPHSLYPVNIHSCAEALLLNATLASDYDEARRLIKPIFLWVKEKMQRREGYHIYMRRRFLGVEMESRISYIRWGQAWMLLALSQVLQAGAIIGNKLTSHGNLHESAKQI